MEEEEESAPKKPEGKKPQKESVRSTIMASRVVPAQKSNRMKVVESDSELEIVDAEPSKGKRKAGDIGRDRQVLTFPKKEPMM